jgi:2-succinyl-5-enolpyruvyl-6-hydroxy-3-cyclohexene-1-carboxylate synthase
VTDEVALRGFVAELVAGGVSEAVVCPGSRSTPLALALRSHPGLKTRVLLDERSAGFFALGLGKATRRPAVVLTTSGTAAANLLPAVVEASLGRVPLLVVTADRPPELRDRGAAQAIDQVRLFGGYAKWFAELPLLDGEDVTRRHVWGVAARAVATAIAGPAGPVHLDAPFREPLVPGGELGPQADQAGTVVVSGRRALDPGEVERLAGRLARVERGLVVAGPQDDGALPAAVARLAAALEWPIVADPLSLVRCGPHDRSRVIARADFLLRPGPWREAHVPDLVLRFGAMATSKPLLALLERRRPDLVVVDGDGGWREPAVLPVTMIHADATWTAHALADALAVPGGPVARAAREGRWLGEWLAAERAADAALQDWLAAVAATGERFEGAPFAHLADLLPDGAILWASSSMPVRDMDAWLPASPRAIRPLANRGANGIDGVVSSAMGAAASGADVVLVIGDVALLHDLAGLVAARLHGLSATIVAVHNDGGGIFSFLPQASVDAPGVGLPEHYEELFGTPHGIDLGPLVTALGAQHRVVGAAGLAPALAEATAAQHGAPGTAGRAAGGAAPGGPAPGGPAPGGPAPGGATGGVRVLEIRTERARNVALHRAAAAAVQAALVRLVPASTEKAR